MNIDSLTNPTYLAQQLIKCPSITPNEGGAIALVQGWLEKLDFYSTRLPFSATETATIDNLYASYIIKDSKNFCFAGHTDVVPPGNNASWKFDPFQGVIKDNKLYGRGAVDMKGAIAAFIAALARQIKTDRLYNTTSLLITGDEEEDAINGTVKVLKWLQDNDINLDFCLVGEPVCREKLGDTIKIGRRGSLNTILTVHGIQGHVAYPEQAQNPAPILFEIMRYLSKYPQKHNSKFFDPSNLEITSINIDNQASNIIPESITVKFNIRFSDQYTCASLAKWIDSVCKQNTHNYELVFNCSGEADIVIPNAYAKEIGNTIEQVIGVLPEFNSKGGTSDARFIRHYCPVIEFGLLGKTMHKVNEHVDINELEKLTNIYQNILKIPL